MMSKENKSRYALLGMLSLAPMSGYDLKKATDISIGHFWQENYAQIYPMLKQLAREGLTTSHVEEQEGKPNRHVYTLTDKGREELQSWLSEPVDYQVYRSELLLKLFFGEQTSLPVSAEHIRQYRDRQVQILHVIEEIEVDFQKRWGDNTSAPYWLITMSYGRHSAQAAIAWCDEALAMLEKLAEQSETTISK
jgi:PadR family transcriptional regulator, regulatory protein AphA